VRGCRLTGNSSLTMRLPDEGSGTSIGGVVGYMEAGVIENCCVMGSVEIGNTAYMNSDSGGVVGATENGKLRNCFFAAGGSISANGLFALVAGIFGGSNSTAKVKNCFYAGSAYLSVVSQTSATTIGGIVGDCEGSLNCCFCFPLVERGAANHFGGVAGQTGVMTIKSCYCRDTAILEGSSTPSMLCENVDSLSAAQFAEQSRFAGFDFENEWIMGDRMPWLRDMPCVVTFLDEDGTLLAVCPVEYGERPVYTGETPEREGYALLGWRDENGVCYSASDKLPAIKDKMTYTAVYGISISDYTELKAFAARVNSGETGLYAVLTADITCTDNTWVSIGKNYDYAYTGIFDGAGHTITGLSNTEIDSFEAGTDFGDYLDVGFFGEIAEGSMVMNLTLADSELTVKYTAGSTYYGIGALAGYSNGVISGCGIIGSTSITAHLGEGIIRVDAGGLIGETGRSSRTERCFAAGNVAISAGDHGEVYAGGIVGKQDNFMSGSFFAAGGSISAKGRIAAAGGIVGHNYSVENCFYAGSAYLSAEAETDSYIGGVSGVNDSKLGTSFSFPAVDHGAATYFGGVVGLNRRQLENCRCRDDNPVGKRSGSSYESITNVASLSAAQFAEQSSFAGFDFENVWIMGDRMPWLRDMPCVATFLDEDGTLLAVCPVEYGETPVYTGETPEKEGYVWIGWQDENGDRYAPDDELPAIKDAMTYTAVYAVAISDYTELKAFAARVNEGETALDAVLTADIICTDKTWIPIGYYENRYVGSFDGRGHTITGLSTEESEIAGEIGDWLIIVDIGLFGEVGEGGSVRDVTLADCVLTYEGDGEISACMGAVAGYCCSASVSGCRLTGASSFTVNITGVGEMCGTGGVVGQAVSSEVRNCSVTGSVEIGCAVDHSIYLGGVAGNVNFGAVSNCFFAAGGSLSADGKDVCVGGVVGKDSGGAVENCFCAGNAYLSATGTQASYIGGIAGMIHGYGKLISCHCYTAVDHGEATYFGGITGYNDGVVKNCYCSDETSIGEGSGSSYTSTENIASLSAEEFADAESFTGFDFEKIWAMGPEYPLLRCF
ncbi:MAG: hypothetical protein IK064_00955, partial [Clostridia bacterium]|nr:hypothetical protein [Clostridia bacterium]